MQMNNTNLHSLIGPNNTVLTGQNHAFWLVIIELPWLVGNDANEDVAAQIWLDGDYLSPLFHIRFQKLLYNGQLSQQECRAGGLAAHCSFPSEMQSLWEALLAMAARLWLWIRPQLITRSSSWQVSSLCKHTQGPFLFSPEKMFSFSTSFSHLYMHAHTQ